MLHSLKQLAYLSVLGTLLAATICPAQQVVVQPAGGQAANPSAYAAYPSPWSGSLRWLMVDAVKKEIELIDDQTAKLDEIRKNIQQETTDLYKKQYDALKDVPVAERGQKYAEQSQKYREQFAELSRRTEEQIEKVLMPEQWQRLKEINLQMRLKTYGGVGYQLASEDLVKDLAISDQQKEKLQTVQQEVMREMQKKIQEMYAKLNAEAQEKVMEVLTPAQKQKLERMMGEKFELPAWTPPGAPAQPKK